LQLAIEIWPVSVFRAEVVEINGIAEQKNVHWVDTGDVQLLARFRASGPSASDFIGILKQIGHSNSIQIAFK